MKHVRSSGSLVEEEEDVILKDGDRMDQIEKVVDKLRTGYHTKLIIEDLGKTGKSVKFSEESSRTIHEIQC